MEELHEQERFRREKLVKYEEKGVDPFGQKFVRDHSSLDIKTRFANLTNEELEGKENVVIAGRIMTIRNMGKAAFFHIKDKEGQIQVYLRKDVVGEEVYDLFNLADLGDIVGVEGKVMLTRTGELTVKCLKYTHLTKALRPLPEKFHGLSDVEERYRRRYVDLIVNDESRKIALTRPMILKTIKNFLDNKGYMEVETPILHPVLGGASAKPFITHHNALDMPFYLRIAPELYLKRLIVGGLEKVYELNRNFRNEGISNRHNPEFTMLELYEAYGDLETMMDIVEEIFSLLVERFSDSKVITWRDAELDFSKGFRRVSMVEMIKEVTNIDFSKEMSDDEAIEIAKEKGLHLEEHEKNFGHIVNKMFEEFCEDKLVQPTILYGHPSIISPLARPSAKDNRFSERFEIFINGVEFGNAYGELNDPRIQKENFLNQLKEKDRGNEEATEMDKDYVEALEYGMPPTGGLGIGIDRVIMLFTNSDNIREVILFPHMRNRS